MAKDLRKLRDEADATLSKGQYKQAATLYEKLARSNPADPALAHRAGELWKKVGQPAAALTMLTAAATGYAKGGFLLKAVAVCKLILEIDPNNTGTLDLLADLYARESAPAGAAAFPAGVISAPPKPQRPQPATTVASRAAAPALASRSAAPVPRPAASAPIPAAPRSAAPDDFGALPATGKRPRAAEIRGMPAMALETLVLGRSVPDARPAEGLPPPSGMDLELEPTSHAASAAPAKRPAPSPAPSPAPEPPPPKRRKTAAAMAVVPPVLAPLVTERPAPPPQRPRTSGVYHIPLEQDLVVEVEVEVEAADGPTEDAGESPEAVRMRLAAAAKAAALPRIPLFSELPRPALRALLAKVERARYAPGEVIIKQGEVGDSLFVIVHGEVEVLADKTPIARLPGGSFFGEIALLTDFPRGATVRAVAQTELLVISRALVHELLGQWPQVLTVLLRFVKDRLAQTLLKSSPLFEPFTPDEKFDLFARFRFLEAEAGAALVEQGKPSTGLFMGLAGKFDVYDQDEEAFAELAPGDLFGEMSLISNRPAMATVRARTKCFVLQLPRAAWSEIMMTHPQVLAYVSDLAAEREARNQRRVEFV